MSKLLLYYAIYFVIVFSISFVYHIVKRILSNFNSEEYNEAWQVISIGYDGEDHSAITKALQTSFTSDEDGNLYVTNHSNGERTWKQVGRDE